MGRMRANEEVGRLAADFQTSRHCIKANVSSLREGCLAWYESARARNVDGCGIVAGVCSPAEDHRKDYTPSVAGVNLRHSYRLHTVTQLKTGAKMSLLLEDEEIDE